MDATMRKARFAHHFSVGAAEALIGFEAKGGADGNAWTLGLMTQALKGFLRALRAEGALKEIPGSKGHDLRFAEAWNRIAAGKPTEDDFDAITEEVGLLIAFQGTMTGDKSTPKPEVAHRAICDYADAGIFSISAGESAVTGDNVYVRLSGWTPSAKAYVNRVAQPLEDAVEIGFQKGEVTFPTGRLLISDWFRCEGFSEAMSAGEPDTSVNSDAGQVASTLHKLSKGVASFHLRDATPDVYLRDGALIIGEDRAFAEHDWDSDGDAEDPKKFDGCIGQVCTDYWGATIVDQKTLMNLLEAQLGSAEAAFDAYAEYRRTTFDRIIEAKVEPGTYEVHFGPRCEDFAKAFRHESLPALAEIAAYGALIPKRS